MTNGQHSALLNRSPENGAGYVPRCFSGVSAPPLPFRDSGGRIAASDRGFCGPTEGRGAGLVYSQTSDTRSGSRLFLDPVSSRLSRMRRSTITAARLITEDASAGGFRWKAAMVTLTYRPGRTYAPRDVSEFLKRVRQWAARRGFDLRYVWVLELTKAGVPHYHVVLWLPKGTSMPKPDKQGWWPHGSTRIEWARNAVGYIAKYASKGGDLKALPSGSRICGSGGLSDDARNVRAWWLSPGWVRHQWTPGDRPRASAGGGWCSLVSGEWLPSPWEVGFEFGRVYIKKGVSYEQARKCDFFRNRAA